MENQKVKYVQFRERNLDKDVFERLYASTGIKDGQERLSLEGGTRRLSVSDGILHESISESRIRTIQIIGEGVRIVMRRGTSPEIRDYLGDVYSGREDWCTIAYSGQPGAMAAFGKMTEEQLSLFLGKVEKLILKILDESPAIERKNAERNLDELMNSI